MPAVRVGILGVSRIAEGAVVSPATTLAGIEITAVASRSRSRAEDAARRWRLVHPFAGYDALLRSPDIDAIYIGLPTSLHAPWTQAALRSGKHVLCEKPLGANAVDARRIAEAAADTSLVVMEAMHWRYHPIVALMRGVLDSGVLGQLEHIDARFDVPAGAIPPDDIRWDVDLAGGAMADLGIYTASWARWVVPGEPSVVSAEANCPVRDIDGQMRAHLKWETGVTGEIHCSMVAPGTEILSTLVVSGTQGTMTATNLIAPHLGSRITVSSSDGTSSLDPPRDRTYDHQLAAFRDAIAWGAPYPTTPDEAAATLDIVDACYRNAGMQPRSSTRTD